MEVVKLIEEVVRQLVIIEQVLIGEAIMQQVSNLNYKKSSYFSIHHNN